MKKLIRRINKKTLSEKGETLIESLVSILILTLLALASAVTVQTALKITGNSLDIARESQEKANILVQNASGISGTITFSGTGGISARHNITIYDIGGLTAFDPQA